MYKQTKGVKILQGDPKKAVLKIAIPMMIGMVVQTLYNLVDGIWVAGLGTDALASIGLFFPVFMIVLSIATGMAVGGSSAISRKIGSKDKDLADSAAVHSLYINMILAVSVTIIILPLAKPIFVAMGAKGDVLKYVVGYSRIILGGSFIIFFSNVASGILRGEGDTKRAMYAMILGSGLNIVLDPIFIYTFKLGVYGAAWASMISMFISSLFMFKWLFIDKSTFVQFRFKFIKYNKKIVKDILKVGVPSSFSQMLMAVSMFFLNIIILKVENTDAIAVFTSAWRIIMIGIVPLMGISVGVTAVTGAAYGAKNQLNLKTAYLYGVKIGFLAEIVISGLIFIFAKQVAYLFTYSSSTASISGELISSLKILVLFLPAIPLGKITSSMFQGIGKGFYAFSVTLLRTVIMQVLFSYLFAITFHMGLKGVWWGIFTGNVSAAVIAFIWGQFVVSKLKKKLKVEVSPSTAV
jgi:putative MATE family efflux protein